jgi:serine phosphatase RsbU (regulator of sigma subunit)
MNPVAVKYEQQLESCSSDVERASLLNQMSGEMCRLDTAQAKKLAAEALEISVQHGFEMGEIEAKINLAQCNWLTGDYLKAVEHLGEILPRLNDEEYLKQNAEAVNLLGGIYANMEKYPEAESYYRQALLLRKKIGEGEGIVRTMNGLGDLFMKQAQHQMALDLFLEAQKVETTNETIKGIVTYNIAETRFHLGYYEDSVISISECLEIGKRLEFPLMIIYSKLLAAKIHAKDGAYNEAEADLLHALEVARKIENAERTSQILLDLSKVYEALGNIPKAFSYFKEHHELKDKVKSRESQERLKAIEHRAELDAAHKETEQERVRNIELKEANFTIEAVKNVLTQKNQEVTDGIRYAQRIQEAMLPSAELVASLFPENFILYQPKEILSGDFYWVSEATTNYKEQIAMAAVVDCTGHGVPAALMGMIANNYLRICEHEPTVNRPSEALDFINVGVSNTLRQEYTNSKIRDGMDMVFIAIDYSKMVLHFAGAKNPIYIIRKGELTEYKGDKHPIGAFVGEEMLKFTNLSIPVEKDDCIYMFSDGFADQFGGPKGKKLLYKRFKEILIKNCLLPMKEQHDILLNAFEEWRGKLEQVDDVCVMGIRLV